MQTCDDYRSRETLSDGKLDLLRDLFGGKRQLIVGFDEDCDQISIEGAKIAEREASIITFHFIGQEITASELINQLSSRYRIRELEVREPDIETTNRLKYEERLLE
jgi:ABC-2 type transport system ATP-binding protein